MHDLNEFAKTSTVSLGGMIFLTYFSAVLTQLASSFWGIFKNKRNGREGMFQGQQFRNLIYHDIITRGCIRSPNL